MRKILLVSLCLALSVALVASVAFAKKSTDKYSTYRPHQPLANPNVSDHEALNGLRASAVQGTTVLGEFDFDSGPVCDPEGWTTHDITSQVGDFFHVTGAGFGTLSGGLDVLDGAQSLWGGVAPSAANPFCGYAALPGYGNSWNQAFCTKVCTDFGTGVTVDFLLGIDSEPGYDATTMEFTTCTGGVSDENWAVIDGGVGVWDGFFDDSLVSVSVPDTLPNGSNRGSIKLRFHFTSDGAWSDEDGLWDTDGPIVIDNLSVSGSLASLASEDFEGETIGDIDATDWESCTPPGYGDFAALLPGITLVLEDPCFSNLTCMWTFFQGSTANYACGGFPGQTAVPYENLRGQYINNEVWSPPLPNIGAGASYEIAFDSYRDLALDPLVFYVWHVRSQVAGCFSSWQDRNFVYFGPNKDWLVQSTFAVGDLIVAGASDVQVALGCVDQCGVWCGVFGTGQCHSHAPLLDNVVFRRIEAEGPQWSGRDLDQFQDNFATDGTTTGTVRVDAANDIFPSANPTFLPGDSAAVTVSDPDAGLAGDVNTGTGPAVYFYVYADNGAAPDYPSAAYSTDSFRYPVVGTTNVNGIDWVCIRMDSTFTQGDGQPGGREGLVADRFNVDLNDNLFVPGDELSFFFCAENTNGKRTYWNASLGSTDDITQAAQFVDEMTCLPGKGALVNGGDILYVDGMNFRGAQPYFDTAYDFLGISDEVDRYDIRGPSSSVANRPGARVVDVFQQLLGVYRKIVWNTGNLGNGLIGDGTGNPEKSDDATMLFTFLDNLANTGGLYLNGDNIAQEWVGLAGAGAVALRTFITHNLVDPNHVAFGLPVSPLVIALPPAPGLFFNDGVTPDQLVAYGGCPLINDFDVLEPTGTAIAQMLYENAGPYDPLNPDAALISQVTNNTAGFNVGVLLSGFSFHYIRDDAESGVPDRAVHMQRVLTFLGNPVGDPVPVNPGNFKNSLTQNYPNPFNPTTTINFTVRDRASVKLNVYNVAGQLVRTLVNDTRTPGVTHTVTWDGRNDAGQAVSSGVYFYKLVTTNFTQTKKMVLLK